MEKHKKTTWIDTIVLPPGPGVVFVHTARPDKRYTVFRVEQEEIYRIDSDGETKLWGTFDDWCDEVRRRTIEIVYLPSH
jgi:hypothetical protein